MKKKWLPFVTINIGLLAFVSFFTDIATEMLYPIMPLYLSDIGYGIFLIGLIEGIAALLTGFINLLIGVFSDTILERKPFVLIGYAVSALVKPLMAVFPNYNAIFGLRLLDRFGKGIRTAPKDAILVDDSTPANRGQVFGFHRSLDNLGATIGPIITLLILYFITTDVQKIILATAIPGALAIIIALFIRKKATQDSPIKSLNLKTLPSTLKNFYKESSRNYKKVLFTITLITLIKSTDVYLLFRARELGLSDILIISVYILYNVISTLSIYYIGRLSDKHGFKKTFAVAMIALSITYALLSQNELPLVLIFATFGIYGIFATIFEGLSNAWISLHIDQNNRAQGLGLLMLFQSIATFLGAIIVGGIWTSFGSKLAFTITALLALLIAAYLFFQKQKELKSDTDQGRTPYVANLSEILNTNKNFRQAIWTGVNMQVTVMNVPVGGEVGLEIHKNIEQFLRIESGKAKVQMGPTEDNLNFETEATDGYSIHVPMNTFHNVINIGKSPLKIYSIYSPGEHPFGTIHESAKDGEIAELQELLEGDDD